MPDKKGRVIIHKHTDEEDDQPIVYENVVSVDTGENAMGVEVESGIMYVWPYHSFRYAEMTGIDFDDD